MPLYDPASGQIGDLEGTQLGLDVLADDAIDLCSSAGLIVGSHVLLEVAIRQFCHSALTSKGLSLLHL